MRNRFHGGNGHSVEGSSLTLQDIHGDGLCHICGKPKAGPNLIGVCSYPHGMMPEKAVDPDHPEGFWTWLPPGKADPRD